MYILKKKLGKEKKFIKKINSIKWDADSSIQGAYPKALSGIEAEVVSYANPNLIVVVKKEKGATMTDLAYDTLQRLDKKIEFLKNEIKKQR